MYIPAKIIYLLVTFSDGVLILPLPPRVISLEGNLVGSVDLRKAAKWPELPLMGYVGIISFGSASLSSR